MFKDKSYKKIEFGYRIVQFYNSFTANEISNISKILFASPFLAYLFLTILNINLIWKYIILGIIYSSLAILYGFSIFVWIMK